MSILHGKSLAKVVRIAQKRREANEKQKQELLDALNHMDELADRGADEGEEKRDLEKSYLFLADFIQNY